MRRTIFLVMTSALLFGASSSGAQEEREHEDRDFTFAWHSIGRGFIGVQLLPLTPELRRHFGVPEDIGVLVSRVEDGGPAEAAGIRVGDILSAVDGLTVDGTRTLSRLIREKEDGDTVTIELYRSGALESYPVTIAERDRRVLDLAGGYRFIPDLGEPPQHDVYLAAPGLHLDKEAMEAFQNAMEGLQDRFDSEEWKDRLERFRALDFGEIQQRMEEVEKRLMELEEELEKGEKKKF